ncbi:MAG: sugar nucleotide-binding protein [Sedimentisphaerales bacterium]|nr:sugar nucleotide-binding protein [Sedimentisphaerales bacterium]
MSSPTPQRILATGITSIHGWPIWKALQSAYPSESLLGICPPATKSPPAPNVVPLCVTDQAQLQQLRDKFQPTCVVHCAGVCDLDVCEDRPQWAYDINVNGAQAITNVFAPTCPIIYMSTDLVFSGNQPPPAGYDETHPPDPVSVAGKTFTQAEQILQQFENVCIVRLGLPLGDSFTGTKGAIDWIKSRLLKNRPVTLFYDEYRSCPWCDQIEQMILAVLALNLKGLYHFGGNQSWSLHQIGQYVLKQHNCPPHLLKGINRHQELNGPPRIGNVTMNCDKLKATLNNANITIKNFNTPPN